MNQHSCSSQSSVGTSVQFSDVACSDDDNCLCAHLILAGSESMCDAFEGVNKWASEIVRWVHLQGGERRGAKGKVRLAHSLDRSVERVKHNGISA